MAAGPTALARAGGLAGPLLAVVAVRALARRAVAELFLRGAPMLFVFAFRLAFIFPKFPGEFSDLFV